MAELSLSIHPCRSVDEPGWLAFREALWDDCPRDEHLEEMASFLADTARFAQFMACRSDDGRPVGFVEASLRVDYVNGTDSSPVTFIEGVYVDPSHRRHGVARALLAPVRAWALAQGCTELASDAAIDNHASHALHRAMAFEETERVVFFRLPLDGAAD